MDRRKSFNPKRKMERADALAAGQLKDFADRVSYVGNSEHKQYPNDYGLTPPTNPRPGKTLCDGRGPFPRAEAEALLKAGIRKGMISVQRRNGWPQNVWAVTETGEPYEAQLENREQGHYHGYPMAGEDTFRVTILEAWKRR